MPRGPRLVGGRPGRVDPAGFGVPWIRAGAFEAKA